MTGPVAPPPGTAGPASWADLLGDTLTALRDVRALIDELDARAAALAETVAELAGRLVDEHAAAIRAERDPVNAGLLEELHP